ncbi:DUF2142 domain-containing protein [Candidatus Saccharibacteria bacterium]|nr:DUF2142 domain-containing protein [Candidatus Saccharibacteria bacterium]
MIKKKKIFFNWIQKHATKPMCFALIFIVINMLLTAHLWSRYGVSSTVSLVIVLIVEVVTEVLLVFFFLKLKKKKLPIEKLFLVLYIPIGLLFVIFLPSQQAPDSYAHLTRAYEVSTGVLVAQPADDGITGATLPTEIRHFIEQEEKYAYEIENLGLQIGDETYIEQIHYPSASGYNPISYAPHAAGILVGRLFHLPIIFVMILGRLFCMLTFAAMAYFAIKTIPRYKTFLAFVCLFPMTIQQTTSYTADAMTLGVTIMAIGFALHLIYDNYERISNRQLAGIVALGVALALCKVVYFPLMGLFILVPWKNFGSKRRKWVIALITLAVGVLSEVVWMKIQTTSQGTVLVNGQFTFILEHPLKYLIYVIGTMTDYMSTFYISSTFGMSLGAWRFDLPNVYFYFALFMTFVTFLFATEHGKVSVGQRLMAWAISSTTILAFMTILFTQWTPEGANHIEGVQGRYFIPLLPLAPVMLSSSKNKLDKPTMDYQYPLLFNMFFCIMAVATIIAVNLVGVF